MGLDLEALKKKYDPEHGWASARDEECREVLALIEELAEAQLKICSLKAQVGREVASYHEATAGAASARASALEEAARLLEQRVILFSEIDVLMTPLEERAHFAKSIRALAQTPPSGRYVESVVLHSILGHIEASMQHTHGVDCRGFDDGDDINSDGDCGCGLVSASKARAALAALEGVKP